MPYVPMPIYSNGHSIPSLLRPAIRPEVLLMASSQEMGRNLLKGEAILVTAKPSWSFSLLPGLEF